MTDRNELRRLAEDAASGPWWTSDKLKCHPDLELSDDTAYIAAASPEVVLGLLDEIERLKAAQGGADRERVKAVRERANLAALVAEAKTFVVSRCGHKGSAPILRLALKEVWAERDQLRAVAVRLRNALENCRDYVPTTAAVVSVVDAILTDPEVEKL